LTRCLKEKGIFGTRGSRFERGPSEDAGQIFHFTDIGYYDTETAAVQRGGGWARAWLDSNF
jgi:hypothetical protein